MNDIDDEDVDMLDEDNDFFEFESENKLAKDGLASKRDFRTEIEKKLELLALKKLTDDYFYDEVFD
jgi:hypothetical protein